MKVPVRLVPRGRNRISFEEFGSSTISAGQAAELVEPSKADAARAQRKLVDYQVESVTSPLNRVEMDLDGREFTEMFKVEVEERETPTEHPSICQSETYLKPSGMLEIPDDLKENFAFAYVPRPVEYFAPLPYPPHENIYHLRLETVAFGLNAARGHRRGVNGEGIRVAMADSGFAMHPYFVRGGYNLVPTESAGSGNATIDNSGHGTGECANIFAIAPRCTVFGVKHGFSAAGTLETCIDQNPHVMTNSWGWSIDNQTRDELRNNDPGMFAELVDIEAVIARAVQNNIVVIFSAGNGHLSFPACLPDVIAVAGVTLEEDGGLVASSYASGFSSTLYPGRDVPDLCGFVGRSEPSPQSAHIMLPVPEASNLDGENFPSGATGTGWGIFSGTSASAPQLAGVVALMRQANNQLTGGQIRNILAATAIDITNGTSATGATAGQGTDLATGAGLVDADAAVTQIAVP